LVLVFLILASFLGKLSHNALAGSDDFFRGWVWNDHVGWISMNCVDEATCGVMDYGVDMDLSTGDVSGYGWSENVGWVCFGSACAGTTPEGGGSYATYTSSTHEFNGWAKVEFENMPNEAWISLNCADPGVCPPDYAATMDPFDNSGGGWGWNGNDIGGVISGLGWFDFSQIIGTKELICDDTFDNDGNGLADCADPNCPCDYEKDELLCTDAIDNDGDGLVDCADNDPDLANSCWHHDPYCPTNEALAWYWDAVSGWYQPGGDITCHDGADNDWDSIVNGVYDANPLTGRDCYDADCAPFCLLEPEDCFDDFDNNWNGLIDCLDPECVDVCGGFCDPDNCSGDPCDTPGDVCPGTYGDPPAPCMCVAKPWLETKYGNVYSELGVKGPAAPVGYSNATYCVLSTGGIDNFVSERSCYITPDDIYNFPSQLNKYRNILGNIDIPGIVSGRYGEVVLINDATDIPSDLGGKIYYSPNDDLDFSASHLFNNGIGNQSGAGLVIVQGDITFDADTAYSPGAISKLRNLASVGWIAFKDPVSSHGGNIYIGRDVDELVGAFYAEDLIQTKDDPDPLIVYGLMVSKAFDFNREYSSEVQGAELVILDGRALTNPPPGMEDLTRSLPDIRDIVPRP